jgi:hypothetical protein
MEIGFAAGAGVPILATHLPSDLTLREYVNIVPSLPESVKLIMSRPQSRRTEGVLINPHASIEEVHKILERIEAALIQPGSTGEPALRVHREMKDLQAKLQLPTYIQ